VLDARRCVSYWTIEHRGGIPEDLRPLLGAWVFGCDVCQEVCPWQRPEPALPWPELSAEAGVGPRLDLAETLELRTEEGFAARFAGTALLRAGREGLLRNAAVVARNVGADLAVPALRRSATEDASPVVREHAAWALEGLDPAFAARRGGGRQAASRGSS
jgi:epoxyqueuosine reductase